MTARRGEQEPPSSSHIQLFSESRSWDDVIDFLAFIGTRADDDVLAEGAQDIMEMEPDMEGTMPPSVAEFIRKHYRPSESTVRVSSRKLAVSLARRLNEVIPPGFNLSAENGWVSLHINGAWDGAMTSPEIADDDTPELGERLETAVYGVLNSVQDSISEHFRVPWPSVDGLTMAMPNVRYSASAIHLWYGDSEEASVLKIPEIPIAEIRDA